MHSARLHFFSIGLLLYLCIASTHAKAQSLDEGMLAYWPFDGSMIDASGNGNNTIPHGGRYATGLVGEAYEIYGNPGANSWVEIPNVINGLDMFSISLWVNEQSQPHPHGEAYISFGASGIGYTLVQISHYYPNSDDAILGLNVGYDAAAVVRPFRPEWVGVWQHYVLTYDGIEGRVKGYMNGTLLGEANYSGAIYPTNGYAGLGKHWWNSSSTRLNALFDEVRIYDRELTASEVMELDLHVHEPPTEPTFYLSPGTNPTGDVSFQNAVGDLEFLENDFDAYGGHGTAISSLGFDGIAVDLSLPDLGADAAEIALLDPPGRGGGVYGTASGGMLLNFDRPDGYRGPSAGVRFSFSGHIVTGFGVWVFDDDGSSADSFSMTVEDLLGHQWTSAILDANPDSDSDTVEGFIGVTLSSGIKHVTIHHASSNSARFRIDHMQIAYIIPEPSTLGLCILALVIAGGWRKWVTP